MTDVGLGKSLATPITLVIDGTAFVVDAALNDPGGLLRAAIR